jgi:saccharopine dehydrogenase-like NADP-dependent oxidoreductase
MHKNIHSVLVIGLGKVGALVAHLLNEQKYQVTGLDRDAHPGLPFDSVVGNVEDLEVVKKHLKNNQAVVTCLPWHLNLSVAQAAHQAGCHYFDLTEDIATTTEIRKLALTAKGIMAPQCGLAPGFVGIIGQDLTKSFETLRSVELRVGALPQHPRGMLGYAFNWSPEGVVNEYLNDCEVIKDGKRAKIPSMEGLETIVIEGVQLEAFATSGGLGTMCESFENRVQHLNYKTIRYPGHCQLMRFFFNELFMKEKRELAGEILVNAKPPVNDDVVYVHAAVEGLKDDNLLRDEWVQIFYPRKIAGGMWKAISWTTSASVCAVLEMVSKGDLIDQGFLKQEEIPLDLFLQTGTGALFAQTPKNP